jgi:hypothetical protein
MTSNDSAVVAFLGLNALGLAVFIYQVYGCDKLIRPRTFSPEWDALLAECLIVYSGFSAAKK